MSVSTPPTSTPAAPLSRALDWRVGFLLLSLIWGSSFLLIKIGTEALEPAQIALGRMVTGAIPLVAVLLLTRGRLPRGLATWAHLSVAAFFLNVVPFTLFGYAEQLIPSALAGIANATTPLFTLAVSLVVLSDERPTRRRLVGLGVGFLGVLVVFGVWSGVAGAGGAGMLLALGAALCYGIGTPYARRFLAGRGHSSLELSTGQLITGTAQLLVVTPLVADAPESLPWRVVLAVTALGALGTGLAYVLMYGIIRQAGATVASTVTYVAPVVAIAAGVLILGETLSWNQPVGAAVIILGAALCQTSARRRPGRGAPLTPGTSPEPGASAQSSRS
ncbi:DMT family transporter [Marinitenerispora sediminis]|uniref:EamA family transporter n=1 Tax=Marinitenerispora sediminis TaxID=1931232 RepID=A0A368T540_9ACTN|nr:DMT family transporter [Marinitenerispora sediminis]RCV54507.1 EamA family transporter [Marinitenerispora sediminis]RCV58725.1 EamA family transporter [Marinitenerispora sediminis]RCV61371.1 EamA family transporter [Marinitenerispora sediminis]